MAHTVIYQVNGELYALGGFKTNSILEITSKLEKTLKEKGIEAEKIKIYRKDFYN